MLKEAKAEERLPRLKRLKHQEDRANSKWAEVNVIS
jgi:hypothetical protein